MGEELGEDNLDILIKIKENTRENDGFISQVSSKKVVRKPHKRKKEIVCILEESLSTLSSLVYRKITHLL